MSLATAPHVAQYILSKRHEKGDFNITPMQLIKLVYIAQGYMLGLHGQPLYGDPVEAWQYGPVIRSVYDAVKSYRSSPVQSVGWFGSNWLTPSFTQEQKQVMDLVADRYGSVDAITLSDATHQPGTPWEITWRQSAGRSAVISPDLIENFYKNLLSLPSHSSL